MRLSVDSASLLSEHQEEGVILWLVDHSTNIDAACLRGSRLQTNCATMRLLIRELRKERRMYSTLRRAVDDYRLSRMAKDRERMFAALSRLQQKGK